MSEPTQTLSGAGAAVLELPKSKLRVVGGELVKVGDDGSVTTRLPVASIQEVNVRKTFVAMSFIVFLTMAIAMAAIAFFVSRNSVVTSLLYAAAVVLTGLAVLGSLRTHLVIRSPQGDLEFTCWDDPADAQGFVSSLRIMIASGVARG